MTLEEFDHLMADVFPARAGRFSLEFVGAERIPARLSGTEDGLRVTMRLVVWDADPVAPSITDVKEQQVYTGPVSILERRERLRAFLEGHRDALNTLFETGPSEPPEMLMPHDLWCPDALKLVRAQTAEDFRRAILARSRLGRFMPR